MHPQLKTTRARVTYALLRRLYFILLFAYVPSLFILSTIVDLSSRGGILQVGFWLPFLVLSIFSLPLFLALLLIGILVNHLLCVKTGRIEGKPARVGTLCYSLSLACLLLTCVSAIAYTENVLPLLSFMGLCAFCLAAALLFVCCHAYLRRTLDPDEETAVDPPRIATCKRVLTVSVIAVIVLAFLLTPYSTVRYDDGGTVKIQALGYAVVKWNRKWDMDVPNEPSDYANEPQRTRVYIFPDNMKSYEELWRLKH